MYGSDRAGFGGELKTIPMNIRRPLRSEQPCQRQMHEKIPEIGRIKNTSVIQGSKARHGCLDSEFLVVSCKLVQHLSAFSVHLALVFHQGFKPDTAVRADAAKLDLALVEKLD